MTDKKITDLTNIVAANLVDADEFVVVDISADETMALTLGELKTAVGGGSGDLLAANNLSDLADAATSRTNLGLGTADSPTFADGTFTGRLTLPTNQYHYSSDGKSRLYYYEDGDTLFRTADDFLFRNNANTTVAEISELGNMTLAGDVTAVDGTFTGDVNIGDDLFLTGPDPKIRLNDNGVDEYTEIYNASGSTYITSRAGASNGNIVFRGGGGGVNTQYGRFSSDGNLGIGTSSPEALLHVADSAGASDDFTAMISSYRPNLVFEDLSGATVNDWEIFVDTGDIAFLYGDATTGTKLANEAMRIKDSGNVGIGTNSPSHLLDVEGSGDVGMRIGSTGTGDADAYIHVDGGDTGESTIYFDTDGVNGASISLTGGAGGDFNISTAAGSNRDIDFQPNNSLAMRIDSSGNVGIGTSSPATALDVNGTVSATTVDLGNWTVTESSGVLHFATGGTNKMKLDASGNLTVVGNVTAYGTI